MASIFSHIYKNKRVFITGNTGFKGSWLTVWLVSQGAKVFGFSNGIPTNPSCYESLNLEEKLVKQYWGDIGDASAINQAISEVEPDIVFHLAAQAIVRESLLEPLLTFQTNIMGTANLTYGVIQFAPDTPLVVITSDKCYENNEWCWGYRENDRLGGLDPYSASKASAETVFSSLTKSFDKKNAVTARAGNVIGGGDWAKNRIVPDAIRSWQNGETLSIRSPSATRPWQHVLEPISGYLTLGQQLLESNSAIYGESFNFGPSQEPDVSVAQLLTMMQSFWAGAKFDSCEEQNIECSLLRLNTDKARAVLGWQPVWSTTETVENTMRWYMSKSDSLFDLTVNQIEKYEAAWAKQKN